MKKATLLSFFLLVCAISSAQTSTQVTDPKILEADRIKQARIADQNQSKQVQISEYFGLEEQILSFLTTKEIPAQLPKATGYATKAKYIESLNTWMKENSSFVLPEKKNQLITE
jgi:hypothetical protein